MAHDHTDHFNALVEIFDPEGRVLRVLNLHGRTIAEIRREARDYVREFGYAIKDIQEVKGERK